MVMSLIFGRAQNRKREEYINMDVVDKVVWSLVAFLVLLIMFTFSFAGRVEYVRMQCYELGWRDSSVDVSFTGYCSKRDNQLDIIKPLKELK